MSKSEAIREFFKKNPFSTTNQEVVEGLAAQGIEVNTNLVNQVRHDYKHKKVRETISVSEEVPLLKVKKLADELGGVDRLIQLSLLLKKLTVKEGGTNGEF